MENKDRVSVLMLVHNAPFYVERAVRSLRRHTPRSDYELCVLDNASGTATKLLLKWLRFRGCIDKLVTSSHNTLFASGNNILAKVADKGSRHLLLLNSDVEIKSDDWLQNLLHVHDKGITAYGFIDDILPRVDGYCYLIDAELYRRHPLDDLNFEWFWAITKQQAEVLRDGHHVQAFKEHERYIHHFGGKSGKAFEGAKGMDNPFEVSISWFEGKRPQMI